MTNLEELYKQYGDLLIQAEIVQAKMVHIKQQIVQELNRPKEPEKKPEVKTTKKKR